MLLSLCCLQHQSMHQWVTRRSLQSDSRCLNIFFFFCVALSQTVCTYMCACKCVCVYLLVKVGVCESCCVQLWSRWRRPPAPSLSFIFFLPPSFTRSPRHTNNLQLGQPWLTLRLYFTHIRVHTHTHMHTLVNTLVDALCVCKKWIKKGG